MCGISELYPVWVEFVFSKAWWWLQLADSPKFLPILRFSLSLCHTTNVSMIYIPIWSFQQRQWCCTQSFGLVSKKATPAIELENENVKKNQNENIFSVDIQLIPCSKFVSSGYLRFGFSKKVLNNSHFAIVIFILF